MMRNRILDFWKNRHADRRRYYEQLNDLDRFGDDVARQIEWTPIAKNGAQFCTRRMVKLGSDLIVFLPSAGFLIFCFVFIGMGGYLIRTFAHIQTPFIYYLTHFIQALQLDFHHIVFALKSDRWVAIPFAALFFLMGLISLIFALRPVFFNLKAHCFIKGFPFFNLQKVSLEYVHALQMLSNESSDDYTRYELNLVLLDRHRINIVCHGNATVMRRQGGNLSEVLTVPFWDMTRL